MESLSERKAAILKAFVKLVSRFGIKKTAMQDVANEVGISVGVIYKDFENKDALVDVYIKDLIKQALTECRLEIGTKKSAAVLLHRFVNNYFEVLSKILLDHHEFCQMIIGSMNYKSAQKLREYKNLYNEGMIDSIEQIMIQGNQEGVFEINDTKKTALLYITAFQSFLVELALHNVTLEEIKPGVEDMYQLLSKAILKVRLG